MRRIRISVFSVIAIVVLLYYVAQARSTPWMFTAFGVLMIVVIVISVIRAWLRP
jgi:membrane protein YdbS with pleckstrin-like domain